MLEINSKLPSTLYGITPEWVEENRFIATKDKVLLLSFLGICIAGFMAMLIYAR